MMSLLLALSPLGCSCHIGLPLIFRDPCGIPGEMPNGAADISATLELGAERQITQLFFPHVLPGLIIS